MNLNQFKEHRSPYKHFRASYVLPNDEYQLVAGSFSAILKGQARGKSDVYRLSKTSPNYDARVLAIDDALARMFAPIFSVETIQKIYDLLGYPFLPVIDGGFHSSPQGSRTGWIHTDFCAAWFDESTQPVGPFLYPRRDRCDYFTGEKKVAGSAPRKYVRAAALLFYLCNEGWTSGDGGETGLYGALHAGDRTVTDFVPPTNNSLLLFECSPHSYHRFIHNPGRVRNSIILWIHATPQVMESRWGLAP